MVTRNQGEQKGRVVKQFIGPLYQYLYEHIYCTDKSRIDFAMVGGWGAERRREQTAEWMLGK
jgi:hypothetical protein